MTGTGFTRARIEETLARAEAFWSGARGARWWIATCHEWTQTERLHAAVAEAWKGEHALL